MNFKEMNNWRLLFINASSKYLFALLYKIEAIGLRS